MLVENVNCKILRDVGFAASVEIIKQILNGFLAPHLQTHSHFVLEIHLNILPQIATYMYFQLQGGVNCWQQLYPTLILMTQFGTHFAAVRAVVNMLAFIAKSKRRIVFCAIYALRQHCIAILINAYFGISQQTRTVLSIVVKDNLQVIVKGKVTFVESELIPPQTSLNQGRSLELLCRSGNSSKECEICVANAKVGEGRFEICGLLHKQVMGIIFTICAAVGMFNYMESGKVTGSRILDDRNSLQVYVAANNAPFNQKMAQISKRDLSRIANLRIFQHSNQPTPNLFYYNASKYQSDDRDEVEAYIAQQLHQFNTNSKTSYAVVYMHSNFVDFIVFRRFVEKWPEHFFRRLRRIYIVGASLMVRFIEKISIGTFYRLCDELFLNLDTVQQMQSYQMAALKELGESTPTPKAQVNTVQIIKNRLYGKTLTEYDLYMGKYPKILLRLLTRIIRNAQQLQMEGIFRKSCNSQELQKLQRRILDNNWQAIDNETDILVVCGCLKKIMNNLSIPLFNYKIYARVIDFSGGEEIVFIRSLIDDMEYVNHKVFVLLTVFLTDFIISQKQFNKMNGYNLSVVFGPCFFRPQEYDLKDLIYSGKFAKILTNCFERQKEIIEEAEVKLAQSILGALHQGTINVDAHL